MIVSRLITKPMNQNAPADFEAETKSRFSTDVITGVPASGIPARAQFRGSPSLYGKKLAGVGVVVLIAISMVSWFQLEERNPYFYLFALGMTAAVLTCRYFTMMGVNGPPSLIFEATGITIKCTKKNHAVLWSDLRSIRHELIRGGQLWEIVWTGGKFDYFVDGLTSAQKVDLKNTISNVKLPHVQIRLEHYDTV